MVDLGHRHAGGIPALLALHGDAEGTGNLILGHAADQAESRRVRYDDQFR
jgi:hypothetical protein